MWSIVDSCGFAQGAAQRGGKLIRHVDERSMVAWERHEFPAELLRENVSGLRVESLLLQRSLPGGHTYPDAISLDAIDVWEVIRDGQQLLLQEEIDYGLTTQIRFVTALSRSSRRSGSFQGVTKGQVDPNADGKLHHRESPAVPECRNIDSRKEPLPLPGVRMHARERRLMRDDRTDRSWLRLCHAQRNDGATAVAEDAGGRLADRTQHSHRVAALLADLEILGDVHRAAGIGAPVVGDDLVLVGQKIGDQGVRSRIPAAAWDHQQRLSRAAYFVIESIPFGFYAT